MNWVKKTKESAFTLIEIVIALAILSVIVTLVYSTLTQVITGKKLLDDRRDSERIASAILNRMTRELQMAFSGIALLPSQDSPDEKISSRINLVGEQKTLSNGNSGDGIRFVALEAGQYLPDGGTHSGLVQIAYRLEENPEPEERSPSEEERYWLIREEIPVIKPHERAFKKRMVFPVSKDVVSLSFEYYDGNEIEWTNEWGSEPHIKLPSIVKFSLKILTPLGKEETFTTAVALRTIY